MALIDKSALVAEIERRIKEIDEIGTYLSPKGVLTNLLCHLDTLEVRDVDLEKEIDIAMPSKYCWSGDGEAVYSKEQMRNFAKHFFELGMVVSNKELEGE